MKKLKLLIYSGLAIGVLQSLPSLHHHWLRNKVANEVVKISNKEGAGGTGVHIKTPSGKVYILTNAHVCGLADAQGIVLVTDSNKRAILRRVLEKSSETDLCLVEPLVTKSGLSVGVGASIGSVYHVLGHPHLLPLAMSSGEIIGESKVQVMDHVMTADASDKCDLPKNKIEEAYLFGMFKVQICTVILNSYLSNITILPGNSGSPLFDNYGDVRALVFAGNEDSHWGIFITMADIKTFIAPY